MDPNKSLYISMSCRLSKLVKSCYNYCVNHKLLSVITVVLLAGSIYGIVSYINYLKKKEMAEIANRYVIKRTFDWISLGDSTDKTIKSIPRACQHKIIYSGDVISQVAVQNVKLGDRLVDNVELYFYKNKLYRIMMYINISFKDYDRRITYIHFHDLFIKNGYKYNYLNYDLRRDYYYDKGVDINHMAMDLSCFGDKHTDLELFNSPLNPEQPQIMLTYYDRDSHYIEDLKNANYISDSIFVQ